MKRDILLFVCLIFVGIVGIFISKMCIGNQGGEAVILIDGREYAGYSLDGNELINIDNEYGHNTIVISEGIVYVDSADCNDQICVKHDGISRSGQMIVCLPHRLVIEIRNGKEELVDAYSR